MAFCLRLSGLLILVFIQTPTLQQKQLVTDKYIVFHLSVLYLHFIITICKTQIRKKIWLKANTDKNQTCFKKYHWFNILPIFRPCLFEAFGKCDFKIV